jgi:RNA polymerase sigma-70 factor (ECF subfamily)
VVLAAGQEDGTRRAEALERLCQIYWEPLYTYLRGLGHAAAEAEDLTQSFLAHLLAGHGLKGLAPEKGKFRSFLLASLKNFLADQRDRATAAKRGGPGGVVLLDPAIAESRCLWAQGDQVPAEMVFDRGWALAVLDRSMANLHREQAAGGNEALFEQLRIFLSRDAAPGEYGPLSHQLGIAPGTVAVTVHRLRQRYGELIRAEIAYTVANPADVEDEMHYLLEVLSH